MAFWWVGIDTPFCSKCFSCVRKTYMSGRRDGVGRKGYAGTKVVYARDVAIFPSFDIWQAVRRASRNRHRDHASAQDMGND
jgi:hypothetical protein